MNHLCKRSLSMIMAILMVLSLIPANPVHVHAEEVKPTEVATEVATEVGNLAELQAALAADNNLPIVVTDTIEVTGEVVLNLNGKTVTGLDNVTYGDLTVKGTAALTITDSSASATGKFDGVLLNYGTLTIAGGTVTSDSNTGGIGGTILCQPDDQGNLPVLNITGGTVSYIGNAMLGMAISADNTNGRVSKLNISGGTITSTGVCVKAEATGSITGGTFTGKDLTDIGFKNITLNGGAAISGGTFNTDVSNYLADGCEVVENADGTFGVQETPKQVEVATLAELQNALAADNNLPIVITAQIVIGAGETVTIDLNGKTVNAAWNGTSTTNHIYALSNKGDLTITDSKGNGSINSRGIYNYGTLTLNGGAINAIDGNGGYAVNNESGSTFVMNGGIVAATYEDDYQNSEGGYDATPLDVPAGCTATLNGGKIIDVCDFTYAVSASGTLNIPADSTIEIIGTHGAIAVQGGKTTINAGKFSIPADKYSRTDNVLYVSGGELEINGGEFIGDYDTASGGSCVCDTKGTATINGGSFKGSSGGDVWGATGTTIKGGSFENLTEKQHIAEGFKLNENGTVAADKVYVAQVGEQKFEDLQEAIKAAAPSGTVTLLSDVTVDEWIMISETLTIGDGTVITIPSINGLTIDGQNHTLTIKEIVSPEREDLLFYNATKLNIKDMTIKYVGTDEYDGGICLTSGTISNVTFEGGRYCVLPGNGGVTIENCNFNGTTSYAIYYETAVSGIVVTGNKFKTASGAYAITMRDNEQFTNNIVETGKVNLASSAKSTVTGNNFGTERFKVYNGATATISGNTINNLVFNDATSTKATFENNTLSADAQNALDAVTKIYVAQIGEKKFESLEAAFAAATEGQTITLLADIVLNETVTVPVSSTVTLDLNGKSISMQESILTTVYAINNLGTLTLKDSVGTGSVNARGIYNGYGNGGDNVPSAKLIVESGTYNAKGTNGGAAIFNYGIVEITGGTFTSVGGYSLNNQNGASMTVAGATANNGIYNSGATLTINGGNISGNRSGCHVIYAWNSNVTINGGEFYNNNSGNATVTAAGSSQLTINDGTFGIKDGRVPGNSNTWTSCLTDTVNTATMTVNGGTFNGGFRVQAGTTMTINGGSYNDCYGSKYNIYGTVTVKGGSFTDETAKSFATKYLAEGYKLAEDGTVVKANYVAEVNGEKFESLQAAIDAVQEGETIILLTDVTITTPAYGQNALNHARAVSFTLDLNGKTLSANTGNSVFRFNIIQSGATSDVTVTIKNGKVVAGANTWCALMAAGFSADVKAVMNLEDLTVEASKAGDLAIKAWDNSLINAKNVTVNATNGAGGFYAVGGEIVLDNCTVNQKGLYTAPYLSMAIAVSSGGKATVNSGIYSAEPTSAAEGYNQGTSHGSWVAGVMNSGGTLIINGGTFSNGNYGDDALATAARGLIFADTNGIVEVNGGIFNALKSVFDFQNNLGTTSPVITVKGGTYSADPSVVTSYGSIVIPAGLCVEKNADGTYSIVTAQAKIGNKYYATLAEAIAAAQDGETVTLLDDINVGTGNALIRGKEITIDLNGHNITGTGYRVLFVDLLASQNKDGKLTLVGNGTVENTGTTSGSSYAVYVGGNSELVVEAGATVKSANGYAVFVAPMGAGRVSKLTVNGGTVTGRYAVSGSGQLTDTSTVITVNSGAVIGTEVGIYHPQPGTVTVNGGTVSSVEAALAMRRGTASITGGTIVGLIDVVGDYDATNVAITGGDFTNATLQYADGNGNVVTKADAVELAAPADYKWVNGVLTACEYVAEINGVKFESLADAIAAAQEGDVIELMAGTIEEGTIKLPATLKNVTFKGEAGAVLKNMTIMASDGNSFSYVGLTFDGITFVNSRLSFTGWRNGEEVIENLTITNCVCKNLNDNTNSAFVHINKDASEPVNGFTFTNNVLDGLTGGSKSGVYAQLTGNVVFTGNVINNVSFRPYVIQVTTDDGIADEFIVTGNTFSGSAAGRAQGLGNNAEGTDTVKLVVSENIFKGITESQQICYWNFNPETTTADLSKNYYDIDILANPNKIYFNSAAQDAEDLIEMGVYPYYADEAMTELVTAPAIMVTYPDGKIEYYNDMLEAVPYTTNCPRLEGAIIKLLSDIEAPGIRLMENGMILDLNGHTYTIIAGTGSQGTNTSGFQIRPEVTTSAKIMNGTIKVAAGAPVVWMFNSYAADFIVEDVTVDCTNMAWGYGNTCYVVVSRADDNVQFTGNTSIVNFNDAVAGTAINVGGTMTIGENVTGYGTIELDAGAKLTAKAGLDVITVADHKVVYADGVYTSVAKAYVAEVNGNKFETLAEAIAAAQNGDEVKILAAGTYKVPTGKNITITGAVDGVVFDNIGAHNMGGASVTFNNVTFNWTNANYTGLQHCGDMKYNNCTINGQPFLYGTSEIFNNCTFNQTSSDAYNVWTYSAKKVEFNECTFNSAGKSVLIYHETASVFNEVTVTKSTFNASAAVDGKAAIEMDSSLTAGIKLTIDSATTATGFGSGNVSGNSLWNNKKGSNTYANNDITVVVNGETVLAPVTFVAKIGNIGYTTIADAIKAAKAGETVTILAGEYTGDLNVNKAITVEGEGTVNIKGKLNITADGATVKNINVNNGSSTAGYISAKDVLVEGCTVVGGNGFRYCYTSGTVTFKDSTITGSTYGIHFDGSENGNIVIDNCVITGWTSFAGTIEKVTMNDTTFAKGNYNYIRFYQDNVVIDGCTFNEKMAVDLAVDGAKLTVTNSTVENGNVEDLFSGADIVNSTITVDNVELVRVAKIGKTYYQTLAEAFAAIGAGDVVIELLADATLDYNARDAYGTAETTSLTINGNGHTLTLNQKNSDWSSIGLANTAAKLVLNNMTIEKTGYGDTTGAWNTHAIIFSCNVEMKDVTVNNGIAVQNGATLNNVTINEQGGYYGLWISGNGQTVTVNGGAINATNGGRGIKIADEYVDAPVSVTLNVTVTKFNTAKKAAVLVTSTAGAKITASNVDIENVAADKVNFVWVDEDRAAYNSKVTVSGCTKAQENVKSFVAQIGENYFKTLAEALTAANNGDTINLIWAAGDAPIAMNGAVFGKTVTITGTATVDWSKGNLFIGRGGEGNGTVIFDNANLTSASNSTSYGIHVSGREKDTNNKYDGTLVINNSTIELDYLIAKHSITLNNSTLTVKNGFSIGGRLANETESGEDAIATINLTNNSKLIVNNHNGMGLGTEGEKVGCGVMNIDKTSTFETTQSFLVTAKGTMNIAGKAIIAGTLTNKGSIVLTDVAATLTSSECGNVTTNVADHMVKYENGAYRVISVVEAGYVAQNAETGEYYDDVFAALIDATAGQTVKLITDAEAPYFIVKSGVTLDLNGNVLTTEYAAAVAGANVIDSTLNGMLKTNVGSIVLNPANSMMAVYDDVNGGYIFTNFVFQFSQDTSYDGEGVKVTARFTTRRDMRVIELLKSGAAAKDLILKVRLTWGSDDEEGVSSQDFTFKDANVAKYFSSNKGSWSSFGSQLFMIVTGFEGVENLKVNLMVVSGTNTTTVSDTLNLTY